MPTQDTVSQSSVSPNTASAGIRVYNTLSREKEPFTTVVPGQVGMYLCGPTVYKPSHIGHMVGPVIFDAIKRYLVYSGYRVTWVVNITDVDDKLIHQANERGLSMKQVAEEMTADYMRNLAAMGVDSIDHFPKATDNIDEIIAMTQALVTKKFAYQAEGDVYFDVSKDPGYGKLSHRSAENMQGEGGDTASRKRNVGDFALWKSAKPGEPSWPSPWGPGRPGWHIECSAMSRRLLGESFDIHGGGLDLIFPHHENEIAQSECCHGKPMARYWMHNGLLQASSEVGKLGGRATRAAEPASADEQVQKKLSKSTGASAFSELLTRHQPETIRFFLLSTHYRRPIDFSDERIEEVQRGMDKFYGFFQRYQRITGNSFYSLAAPQARSGGDFDAGSDTTLTRVAELRAAFLACMDDDFNTGGAIGELNKLVPVLNKYCDDEKLETTGGQDAAKVTVLRRGATVLRELAGTMGLFRQPVEQSSSGESELVGKLMELVIEIRNSARKNKDFATADQVRKRLTEIGVTLEDRAGVTEWKLNG